MSKKVLVVDDDPDVRLFNTTVVEESGHTPIEAPNGEEGLKLIKKEKPDLVILDVNMPEPDGFQVARSLRASYPDLPVVIMTAHSDLDSAVAAYHGGAFEYLPKPLDGEEARAQVRDEVRLLLVLLDVVAVGFPVDPPVQVAEIVAGGVLAVLGELDGEAFVRAAVQAGNEPLDRLAGLPHHQGVVLAIESFPYADFDDQLSLWQKSGRNALFLLLDGITDPHNLGAILRVCEGAGVERVLVREGDRVRKGQVLARIDDGGMASGLEQLKTQAALAETTFERQKRLWEQNIGSEIQYLQAKTNYEAAVSAVQQAESQLAKSTIRATFNGIVDEVMQEEGSTLNPAAGMAVFRLVNLSDMYVEVDVPER